MKSKDIIIIALIVIIGSLIVATAIYVDNDKQEVKVDKIVESKDNGCSEFYPEWETDKEFSDKQKALREDYIRQWHLNKERLEKRKCFINPVYCNNGN